MKYRFRVLALVCAYSLTGCLDETDIQTNTPVVTVDEDGDNVASPEDCNDGDGSVYPGAVEVCDEKDNDCNGAIDEGLMESYYLDSDGDGYGVESTTTMACTKPPGSAGQGNDCDDTDPEINPAESETCDGSDNNCDGSVDEGVKSTFYADTDGDGYGSTGSTTKACELPTGYASLSGDCNDADKDIHPGADEGCEGNDDNCDGVPDPNTMSTWYVDGDHDTFGSEPVAACTQPSGTVPISGDCNDGNALVYPGAQEICDQIDNDCDGTTDDACWDVAIWDVSTWGQ